VIDPRYSRSTVSIDNEPLVDAPCDGNENHFGQFQRTFQVHLAVLDFQIIGFRQINSCSHFFQDRPPAFPCNFKSFSAGAYRIERSSNDNRSFALRLICLKACIEPWGMTLKFGHGQSRRSQRKRNVSPWEDRREALPWAVKSRCVLANVNFATSNSCPATVRPSEAP